MTRYDYSPDAVCNIWPDATVKRIEMPRYFFVQPQVERPVGGVNVTLQMIDILQDAGYDAYPLYSEESYRYDFFNSSRQSYYHPPLRKIDYDLLGRYGKVKKFANDLVNLRKTSYNQRLDLRPDDVVILPEFIYDKYHAIFSDQRLIISVQSVFALWRALRRDKAAGTDILRKFEAAVTISTATTDCVKNLTDLRFHEVSQSISSIHLDPSRKKLKQIAYMPRKRKQEVDLFLGCIRDLPVFQGWTFRAIDNAPLDEVGRILSESLVFLSFSEMEGFGLPPAEAMAAGCVVIGYTGVGGEEFFAEDASIPIADRDIVAFATALQNTVAEYDRDPSRLDAMRLRAAERIARRYNPDTMRASLLEAWKEIGKR